MTYTLATSHAPQPNAVKHQLAALCWRRGKKGIEYLLITSRGTGRWLIPKGWQMKGIQDHTASSIEAWQEAGVHGIVHPQHLGEFSYCKTLKNGQEALCQVTVYTLYVTELADEYPEVHQRQRKWHRPTKAVSKVREPQLKQIMLDFAHSQQDPDAAARPRD